MSIKLLKVINKLISYFKSIKNWLIKPKPSKPAPIEEPKTFYTTPQDKTLNKCFQYAVYIESYDHSDPFTWDDPYMPSQFMEEFSNTLIRWALSNLYMKTRKIEDTHYPQMFDWFLRNIVGDYKATVIGHKQTTCVYCFFKKEEDAVLFKMTWL